MVLPWRCLLREKVNVSTSTSVSQFFSLDDDLDSARSAATFWAASQNNYVFGSADQRVLAMGPELSRARPTPPKVPSHYVMYAGRSPRARRGGYGALIQSQL